MATPSPVPGFTVKLSAADKTRHYVNICSHAVIERPLDPGDREVDDAHLRLRGLENLRIPLLTGLPRTVVLPGADAEEAVCVDVVFCPAVLAVALAHVSAEDGDDEATGGEAGGGVTAPAGARGPSGEAVCAPAASRRARIYLVDLALKNAEEELGYKLPRTSYAAAQVAYRGGVGGGKAPVPMPNLRKLVQAREHEAKMKAAAETAGPWSSKRKAAGKATNAKIEVVGSDELERARATPLIKKGFLNSSKKTIYPEEGSSEGMLYGDVKVAGDPLGYIPKGLRSRVNFVDTATTSAADTQKVMAAYADGKAVPKQHQSREQQQRDEQRAAGGAAGGSAGGAGGGGGGGGVTKKGFLNGKGSGSLYPEGSSEGRTKPSEMDALRHLLPNQGEMDKAAAETDPNDFMADLARFSSVLGLDKDPNIDHGLAAAKAQELVAAAEQAEADALAREYDVELEGEAPPAAGPAAGPAERPSAARAVDVSDGAAGEAAPEYDLAEAEGCVTLKVRLPELSSLAEAEVDISDEAFRLHAPGLYRLQLEWPRAGASDDAKAKFLKKSRTLQVTMPLVV